MAYELSVLVPSYNKAQALRRNLQSLSFQTLPHDRFEVLVLDDGSTDTTRHVVEQARMNYDYRIRYVYIHRPYLASVAHVWNVGIKTAMSDLIVQAGADTILAKDALDLLLVNFAETEGQTYIFGQAYSVHSPMTDSQLDFIPWGQDVEVVTSLLITPFHHSSYWRVPILAMLPKRWFEAVRGYDESWPDRWPDDADMWVRLEASGVSALNALDVWGIHQYHPSIDPVCGPECLCPLAQKSKTWPGPGLKYNGVPEDICRNPTGWGEMPEGSYEA